jgi:hypothetical protein
VRGGWRHIFFSVRVDKTGDQVRQTRFFSFNAIVLFQVMASGYSATEH